MYGGWGRAEECCSGWSCTQGLHVHSLLCRVWGGPPPCCLCSKCREAATSSSHSHTAVATKAEAKQQRKNNGNKSYSILKLFSGSCLRENKELLPKPTLGFVSGPKYDRNHPIRNFRRAVLYFQSLRWESCRSSVCLGILLLHCLCLAVEIQAKSCIPKVLPWDSGLSKLELQTLMHSCRMKWNFLPKPVSRCLRKSPCFAAYHKIHFAEGTNLECCTQRIMQEVQELWLETTPVKLGLAGTLLLYYSTITPTISLPQSQGASFVLTYHSP